MVFIAFSVVLLFCFSSMISAASTLGYFYFTSPTSRTDVRKEELPLVRAGDFFRIEWSTKPSDPSTVTLEFRLREDVGGRFTMIGQDLENNNYYDWKIPENLVKGQYIFKISSNQKQPAFVNQTSQPITVYQGRDAINGKIFIDNGSSTLSAYASVLTLFIAVFYAFTL